MKRNYFIHGFVAGMLVLLSACKKPNLEVTPTAGSVGTISNYLGTNFDLSLFYAAVQQSGLADSLDQTYGAYTVFAPVNTAFYKDSLFKAADLDKWATDSLKRFVRNHILPTKLFYTDIPPTTDTKYRNLNGVDLYVSEGNIFPLTVNGVVVQQAGALVAYPPAYGTTLLNGVIYPLVNTLKVSTGTVQDLIASMPALSHLQAGLKKFGLWDRLSGAGPFTVVAPPDTAFERYGLTLDSIGRLNPADYDSALFGIYYISPNHIFPTDLAQLQGGQQNVIAFPSISDTLSLLMTVINNDGMLPLSVGVSNVPVVVNAYPHYFGPTAAPDYSQLSGTHFLGENNSTTPNGTYINYTCSNGILHLVSGILLRPSDVEIH